MSITPCIASFPEYSSPKGERSFFRRFDLFSTTSLISKKEAQISRVDQMIDKTFEGSLPSFINAFVSSRKINADELKEIEEMIESMKKEK